MFEHVDIVSMMSMTIETATSTLLAVNCHLVAQVFKHTITQASCPGNIVNISIGTIGDRAISVRTDNEGIMQLDLI